MLYRITYVLHGTTRTRVGSYATIHALADWLAHTFRIAPTVERVGAVYGSDAEHRAHMGHALDDEYEEEDR